MDLNHRPHAYQACALTSWAIGPSTNYNINLFEKLWKSFKTKQKITVETEFTYLLNITCIFLPRKEVIHPHVLVGIPCYDFTPIICPTLDGSLLAVKPPALGITNSHGVTGGVYKTRERIHRNMLIYDY